MSASGETRNHMVVLTTEIIGQQAWFDGLPASLRDDLGDHNFAVAQHDRGLRLAQWVQRFLDEDGS